MSLKPECPEGYIFKKKGCKCVTRKKCQKGFRRNKETKECEPKNKSMSKTIKSKITKSKITDNLFSKNTTLKLTKTKTNNKTKKVTKKGKLTLPENVSTKERTIMDEILSENLESLKPSLKSNLSKTKKNLSKSLKNKTKKVTFKTPSKSIARTGKRCPKGYRWNPLTTECDPKEEVTKMLSTIFSIPESKTKKSKTKKSKTEKSKTKKSKTEKVTKKSTKSAIRKSKTVSISKIKTKVTKTRINELSKTLKKSYSPTVNQKIQSLISQTPHKDIFVNVDCNLLEITIVTDSGEQLCYDWKSKEAQKYLLDNLSSTKKIVPHQIIGPAQTDSNCWMNTFFAIFFLSDKGRKFLRFFREAMITGKLQTKTKLKKFNDKIHKAFWILNRFITASLLGTQDVGEYAKLIDTNDVVQSVYEALPKKYRYKPSKEAGNPIQFYFSILRYLENFGHGSLTPFPLHTYRIPHDKEALDGLSENIKSMEKIPHMIIVEIFDDPLDKTYNVSDFDKPLIITSGKYQYELDAVAIRDVERNHVCALITINGTDYKLDGEDFSPVRKLKWKNLINTNKSFKITKTIGEKYNFKKSYQALVYYRTK